MLDILWEMGVPLCVRDAVGIEIVENVWYLCSYISKH